MTLKQLAKLVNDLLEKHPECAEADIVVQNKDTPHAYESRQVYEFPKGFKVSLGNQPDSHAVNIGFITGTKVYRPKRKKCHNCPKS